MISLLVTVIEQPLGWIIPLLAIIGALYLLSEALPPEEQLELAARMMRRGYDKTAIMIADVAASRLQRASDSVSGRYAKRAAKVVTVLALALLLPSLASAQERPSLKLPTLVYAGAALVDDWSTVDCSRIGCHERNPTLRWVEPYGLTPMLTLNEGISAAGIWALHKWMAPTHPKLAAGTIYAVAGLRVNQARLNWREADKQRAINARIGRK